MEKENVFMKENLTKDRIENFMLFDDEKPIFALREHWLTLLFRTIRTIFLGITITILVAALTVYVIKDIMLAIFIGYFIFAIAGFVLIRDLIHWSFHLYIATDKQLIEIHYNPLFSHVVNSILLEQIRCTEIDVDMFGIVPELIGIGNVVLTFDRPTHREEFVLKGIRSPRKFANILSSQIHQTNITQTTQNRNQPLWVKELKTNKYKYLGGVNYGYSGN